MTITSRVTRVSKTSEQSCMSGGRWPASPKKRTFNWLAVIVIAAACAGCMVSGRDRLKKAESNQDSINQRKTEKKSPTEQTDKLTSFSDKATLSEGKKPSEDQKPLASGGGGKLAQQRSKNKGTEEDQVRQAAREMAGTLGSVLKIKVCHRGEEDEWWVTLYEDIGSIIDIKQYIWNRDSEKLEPFLVVKRIPTSRLEADARKEEPRTSCSLITPRPKGR